MPRSRILFFDDDPAILDMLHAYFRDEFDVLTACDVVEAQRILDEQDPEVIVSDKRMPGIDGIDFLVEDMRRRPDRIRIMLTGITDRETILDTINRAHVWAFFEKPIEPSRLRQWRIILRNALEVVELRKEVRRLRAEAKIRSEEDYAAARLERMGIHEAVERVAGIDRLDIVLQGETGTGKNLVARAIHHLSPRRDRPFRTLFVPNLPKELIEAELFGYKAGSFTGAARDRKGAIEMVEGGTLFLDEITEIPPPLQVKLLRFLQEKAFETIGSSRTKRADVRIIAATNRDLPAAVAEGSFRKDLYYRLGHTIVIPPLRDRPEELPELIDHFFVKHRSLNERVTRISDAGWRALLEYEWPGNIRELDRRIRDAFIHARRDALHPVDLFPDRPLPAVAEPTLRELKARFEREVVRERLLRHRGNRKETARSLGITYEGLYKILKKHEIS